MTTKDLGVSKLILSSVLAGLFLAGCGGGSNAGSNGGGGSTPPAITSVSVSSSASSITTAQTATCSATVLGTGAYSSAVTWTATNGTITQAGVLTPAGAGTSTCTATSTQDSSKSASANIAVTLASSITSVSVSGLPSSMTLGQTVTCTAAVTGTGAYSSAVTWTATNGTITSAGVLTPSATGNATCTATSTQDSTKSGSGTVTVIAASPTVTSVSVSCNPTAIMATQTSQCSASVQGTGAFSNAVSWSATNGTITSSGVFTGSGAGPAVITATSLQAGYTTVSGSANVTVTAANPVITSISLPWFYCDAECGLIANVAINGTGFQSGDTVTSNPTGFVYSSQFVNSTQILITLPMDTPHTSPGWLTFTVTSPDGSSTSSIPSAYLGNQNMLGLSASNELYFLDQGNGYVRKYKSDGTLDGTLAASQGDRGIAFDDKSGDVLATQNAGASVAILNTGSGAGNGTPGIAVSAKNSFGCITQPTVNYLSCLDLTQFAGSLNSVTVGSQPFSLAMGLFGTETDAFVFSRDGNPTLWKVNVSGGMVLGASQSLPGFTPVKTLQAANPFAGGWHVAVFDSGPASGIVAVLSTADNQLVTLNTSTMGIIKQVTLPGVPFRMVADKTNGNLIVAFADLANVRTTFAAVNPTTGVVTPLTSTSAILAVGLQVSSDGKSLYACQRAECDVLPNK